MVKDNLSVPASVQKRYLCNPLRHLFSPRVSNLLQCFMSKLLIQARVDVFNILIGLISTLNDGFRYSHLFTSIKLITNNIHKGGFNSMNFSCLFSKTVATIFKLNSKVKSLKGLKLTTIESCVPPTHYPTLHF